MVAWSRTVVVPAVGAALALSGQTAARGFSPSVAGVIADPDVTGVVIGWGYNGMGQTDVPVQAQAGVTAVVAGSDFAAALASGRVVTWARADGGDLPEATQVPPAALSGVSAISALDEHILALKDGAVLAWGWPGMYGATDVPQEARSGVSAIAAGRDFSLALKDGRVIGWGDNTRGQIDIPADAQSGVDAISAGWANALALKDGRVIAWGLDADGRTDVPADALSGVDQIAAGGAWPTALKDGRLITWGAPQYALVPDDAVEGVDALDPGGSQTVVKDGRVIAWSFAARIWHQPAVPDEATRDVTAVASSMGGAYLAIRQLPLGIPRHLSVKRNGGSASLTWIATVPQWGKVTGYRVDSAPQDSDNWTVRVANTGTAQPSATVTGLPDDVTLRFRVTALSGTRVSPTSEPSSGMVTDPEADLRVVSVSMRTADGVPVSHVRWRSEDNTGHELDSGTSDDQGRFFALAMRSGFTRIYFSADPNGMTGALMMYPEDDHADIVPARTYQAQVNLTDTYGAPIWNAVGKSMAHPSQLVPDNPALTLVGPLAASRLGPTGRDGRMTLILPRGVGDADLIRVTPPDQPEVAIAAAQLQESAADRRLGSVVLPEAPILEDASVAGKMPGAAPATVATSALPTVIVRTSTGRPASTVVNLFAAPVPDDPTQGTLVATGKTDPKTGRVTFADLPPGGYWAALDHGAARVVEFKVPKRPPSTIQTPRASEAAGAIRVSWAKPFDGGAPITGYTVTSEPGGRAWHATGTHLTISGLTPGTSYRFRVSARNSLGDGAQSKPSARATYRAKPTIHVKAASHGDRLHVDVDPDRGRSAWTLTIERRRSGGTWRKARTIKTKGAAETLNVNLARGIYRVRMKATTRYAAAISKPVTLTR